jgi:hypothetical protein
MTSKSYGPYVSVREAAEICGVTIMAMDRLVKLKLGPAVRNPNSHQKFKTSEVKGCANAYPDPNLCLAETGRDLLFALHMDGRRWLLQSRDFSKNYGLPRYFTGQACERGHVCERYTESRQCVECAKIEGSDNSES